MSLPDSWVNEIFSRLGVRYGAAFLRQWPDAPVDVLKADWAQVLAGFEGRHVKHALDHLPETPLNAAQFRVLCLNAPAPAMARLPSPVAPRTEDRAAKLKALGEKLRAALDTEGKGPDYTAKRLRAIAAQRPLTEAQKAALKELERVEAPAADMGTFHPIPREMWPWVQRGEA